MSFTSVPDLISCQYDDDTDPSPTPPEVSRSRTPFPDAASSHSLLKPYPHLDGYQYNAYPMNVPSPCSGYMTPQPTIINSIEFTDLTHIQHEERVRGQRRSTTAQDKEAASNMRIVSSPESSGHLSHPTVPPVEPRADSGMQQRRRAQNRASQRAFRERKEKHVQNLEHQLQELETKHRELSQSYSDLDSNHRELKAEADVLRHELNSLRRSSSQHHSSASTATSREGSVDWDLGTNITEPVKQEGVSEAFYDPFCGSNGALVMGDHHASTEAFFGGSSCRGGGGGGGPTDWGY